MIDADASDLLGLTAALVDVGSVSGDESTLADLVEQRLRDRARKLRVDRVNNNVVARTVPRQERRVVLAGHLDTVPENGNGRAVVEGEVLAGLGSADMKGGLAVMLLLAEELSERARFDCTFVFYEGEEVAEERNGMRHLFATRRELVEGDFAVLLEPTDGRLEAGCQGTIRIDGVFHGARAHTARPWMGRNAIHAAAPVLGRLAAYEAATVEVDGVAYRESLQVVKVQGGVAGNVVPDRCVVEVNRRYAPSRALEEVVEEVRLLLGGADEIVVRNASIAAHPNLAHPLVAEFAGSLGLEVRGKLGWTDVARFTEQGIPAVNFGPGDPEIAHTAGERVARASLDGVYDALRRFLAG